MDSRFRGNDKEKKTEKEKLDSRFRGNDKEKKTEKENKKRKNMGKMPMLHMGETPMLRF